MRRYYIHHDSLDDDKFIEMMGQFNLLEAAVELVTVLQSTSIVLEVFVTFNSTKAQFGEIWVRIFNPDIGVCYLDWWGDGWEPAFGTLLDHLPFYASRTRLAR